MKKLRLEVEELRIESFQTDAPAEERGTVAGHMITQGAETCYHCTRWSCPPTGLCL